MTDLSQQFGENTIEEPVSETILRDLRLVGRRLLMVMIPSISSSAKRAELRDWDLWGPFFLCMSLAVMLSITAHDEASVVFSVIFVIIWVGAAVITINGQLLGGRLSFFQSVCFLGYCIFPILLSAVACWLINSFVKNDLAVVFRFLSVFISLLWSIWASSSFMTDARFPEGRKLLALYPVILFYLSLAWIVLIGFQRESSPHSAIAEGTLPNNVTVGGGSEGSHMFSQGSRLIAPHGSL
ncbi:unnamed protein product [Agarophyton chilense]